MTRDSACVKDDQQEREEVRVTLRGSRNVAVGGSSGIVRGVAAAVLERGAETVLVVRHDAEGRLDYLHFWYFQGSRSAIPTGYETEDEHMAKNTICLWYDKDAEAAARFYTKTFPDSAMGRIVRAPSDYPSGKKGDVLTVEFTVVGVHCMGLNGGPEFKHNEAFSFQIATDDQDETDRYWNAIVGNGGQESACGWCKDKWGVSWQITPRVLTEALATGGEEARRAFEAMMPMKKIDVATIEAARRG